MKKTSLIFACVAMMTAAAFAGNVTNKKESKKEKPKTSQQSVAANNPVKHKTKKESPKKVVSTKSFSKKK